MDEKEPKPDTKTELPSKKLEAPKTPEQLRAERLSGIDTKLQELENVSLSPEEIQRKSDGLESDYASKVTELETGLDTGISKESKRLIHQRMVGDTITSIKSHAERQKALIQEKEQLRLKEAREEVADYISRNNLESELAGFEIPDISDNCRVSVVIPAFGEGQKITKSLQSFLEQEDENGDRLQPDLFEVVVVVNQYPDADEEAKKLNQKTIEAIEELQRKNPGYKIHSIFKEFPTEQRGVGSARKIGTDLALLRDHQRTERIGDDASLYIAGTDADTIADKQWVSKIITQAEKTNDEAFSGRVSFDENLDLEVPGASDKIRAVAQEGRNLIVEAIGGGLGGVNFVVRKDVVARMDGLSTKRRGEDVENTQKLKDVGGSIRTLDVSHTTSSRRLIDNAKQLGKEKTQATTDESYEPVKETGEVVEVSDSDLDEHVAHSKMGLSKFFLNNITMENLSNPETRTKILDLLGEKSSEIEELSGESLRQKIDEIKTDPEYTRAVVERLSTIFKDKIPMTAKDEAILGQLQKDTRQSQ